MSSTVVPAPAPWAFEPGVQRWRVDGGSSQTVALRAGDELTLIDVEGFQRAELTVPGSDGPGRPTLGLPAALGLTDPCPVGGEGRAGQRWSAVADRTVTVRVTARGRRMPIDAHDPPGPLLIEVRRGGGTERPGGGLPPPPPLHDALVAEWRVPAGTAFAYEVHAGHYVQVIDVEGRECSDLLAFRAAGLAQGREVGLDPAATRTLTGRTWPTPGLASRYVGVDLRPLLEVVRDTVGRHDTFALACNARYYADAGYPGHPNCTDNFNRALDPYGVAPRAGWPAMNLFYNTSAGDDGELRFDEPWSRPGDYVVLRALDDLVMASSACPDDTSPANGWCPTDVVVRVYGSAAALSPGRAQRATPNTPPRLTRQTGFHPRTCALTRRFVDYRGFWLPQSYTAHGPIEEYWACRERVAVMDLTPLRKWEVVGPDAEALLQATLTRDVRRLAVGRVVYTALCTPTGAVLDDATCFRLGPDRFRLVGGDDYDGVWLREQAAAHDLRAWVRDSSAQIHNLAVQGPASRDMLRPLLWTPAAQPALDELSWFGFTIGRLGGADGIPVLVSRTGYSGELGYELWCHPDDAVTMWDLVWEAGREFGLLPLGLDALEMLRVEAGLAFGGAEFGDEIDPFEAGIGFTVALRHDEDFVGRAALEGRRAHPQRTLVGLRLDGREVAKGGDGVYRGRDRVGVVTSATRSPVLRASVALARVAVQCAAPGTTLEIGALDGHQKRLEATVVPFPFYDPEKKRPRS